MATMTNYELQGWEDVPTLQAAGEKLQLLLSSLAPQTDKVCFEEHFSDYEAAKALAEVVSSPRFACYCWRPLRHYQTLLGDEFRSINQAQLIRRLTIAPSYALPPYDWNGTPTERANLTFAEHFKEPVYTHQREGDPATAQLIGHLIQQVLGATGECPVKITTSLDGNSREHLYIASVPSKRGCSHCCGNLSGL